jgi:hypothetical protein
LLLSLHLRIVDFPSAVKLFLFEMFALYGRARLRLADGQQADYESIAALS